MNRATFSSFGVGFWSILNHNELIELAKQVDTESNIESFWIAEVTHYRSVIPLLSSCALTTRRVKLGSGIIGSHSRHPAITAMEAATLSELSGGRFILGLGAARVAASSHKWQSNHLETMRDALRIVVPMLKGETVNYEGSVFNVDSTKLNIQAGRVPVYVGCYPTSKRTLELAAELADGVILLWVNAELIEKAVTIIDERMRYSGRNPSSIDKAAYLILSVDNDAEKAKAASRPLIEFYASRIMDFWKRSSLVPDSLSVHADMGSLVERLTISGTPNYCLEKLDGLAKAGLKTPIFYQVLGPDRKKAIKVISNEIIPSL